GKPLPEGTRLTDGGRFSSRFDEQRLADAESLAQFAEAKGHTLLELAFSWLLAHPAVASVIAGATSPAQVRSNAAAASWRLTAADLRDVDELQRIVT
ncbi:MAG: aldo/keto reductase, partial [Gemmatimonadota bacterium]|nr:aldo/keto reductase [Gemmatimonadota bacterium]